MLEVNCTYLFFFFNFFFQGEDTAYTALTSFMLCWFILSVHSLAAGTAEEVAFSPTNLLPGSVLLLCLCPALPVAAAGWMAPF